MTKSLIQEPQNGEIWFVNIPNQPNDPHQPRTAVIVSTNGRNKAASDVIVVPTTSSKTFRPHPVVHVQLPAGEGGLPRDSYARCDQVTTIDKSLLSRGPLGLPISLQYRWKLLDAIRVSLGDTRV
jgi:mRNA-degrading endonuclease toxin of MazEF toxin-antitoxin module